MDLLLIALLMPLSCIHGIDLDSIDPSVFDELAPRGIKYMDILRPENIGNLTFQHQIDQIVKKINLTYFYLNLNSYYISEHKFWEFDWRTHNPENTHIKIEYYLSMFLNYDFSNLSSFMISFPDPPIINPYPEIVDNCELSAFNCLEYIGETTIINRGTKHKKVQYLETENLNNILTNTFEDLWQLFNFRATASYYLCWFTLNRNPLFKKFKPNVCNVTGLITEDFKCAEESFCPDPCCGKFYRKIGKNPQNLKWNLFHKHCQKSKLNPCHGIGSGKCRFSEYENNNFEDMKLNKFNISCDCPTGFIYSNEHKICVDIDECFSSTHNCKASENEYCLNLPGTYKCICAIGFLPNKSNETSHNSKCIRESIIFESNLF